MKKSILAIVFFSLFLSCKKKVTPDVIPQVEIHYTDSSGNDLFSAANDGQTGYWLDSVRIYDYEKGIETLIYQAPTGAVIYDNPYGYAFNSYGQGEIMDVFPNEDVINHYSNSIIKLKEGVYDTLKVHLTGTQVYSSLYDSIWYNSKLQVPLQGIITIVK